MGYSLVSNLGHQGILPTLREMQLVSGLSLIEKEIGKKRKEKKRKEKNYKKNHEIRKKVSGKSGKGWKGEIWWELKQ